MLLKEIPLACNKFHICSVMDLGDEKHAFFKSKLLAWMLLGEPEIGGHTDLTLRLRQGKKYLLMS